MEALGPDISKKVMGGRLGAQGAASTHRSPQKSHGFTETAEVRNPGQDLRDAIPPACTAHLTAAPSKAAEASCGTVPTCTRGVAGTLRVEHQGH